LSNCSNIACDVWKCEIEKVKGVICSISCKVKIELNDQNKTINGCFSISGKSKLLFTQLSCCCCRCCCLPNSVEQLFLSQMSIWRFKTAWRSYVCFMSIQKNNKMKIIVIIVVVLKSLFIFIVKFLHYLKNG